jgi:hypothetical protein
VRYPFTDANGRLLYEKLRYERPDPDSPKGYEKSFLFRRPSKNGIGKPLGDLGDTPRVLYNLQGLATDLGAPVHVTEGEKNADDLLSRNLLATTVGGGWGNIDLERLRGRDVYVHEDCDDAGPKKSAAAAKALYDVAKSVRIVRLPGLDDREDVSDWLRGGYTVADLIEQCLAAPLYQPESGPSPQKDEVTLMWERMSDVEPEPVDWIWSGRIAAAS